MPVLLSGWTLATTPRLAHVMYLLHLLFWDLGCGGRMEGTGEKRRYKILPKAWTEKGKNLWAIKGTVAFPWEERKHLAHGSWEKGYTQEAEVTSYREHVDCFWRIQTLSLKIPPPPFFPPREKFSNWNSIDHLWAKLRLKVEISKAFIIAQYGYFEQGPV